ncbi:MAG: hypothetical protein J6X68_05685 [Lachnospiraceae bacterium]|nr:hypothetical protein [Lachnospiraceae bacterium]
MIKVLKTDLYRLFRSKAFLFVFPIYLVIQLGIGMFFSADTVEVENGSDRQGGIVIQRYDDTDTDVNVKVKEKTKLPVFISTEEMFGNLYTGQLMLFLGVVLVIFCTCETRMGFVKNAAGAVSDRAYMTVSKMIVGAVILVTYIIEYAVMYVLTQLLQGLISGRKIKYLPIPEGEGVAFIKYLLLCIFIHLVFIALIAVFHELTYNRALGIVVTFMFATTLIEEMIKGVVYLGRHFFDIWYELDINRYLLMTNIGGGYKAGTYHPQIVLILSLIYFTVFTGLAVFISRKKEIR